MERDGRRAFRGPGSSTTRTKKRAHADKKRADATEFGPVSASARLDLTVRSTSQCQTGARTCHEEAFMASTRRISAHL